MRQKLITLDLTSFETASNMKNFSEWVRIQLRKYRDDQQKPLDDDLDAARFKLQHGRWPQWYRDGEEE